MPTPARRRGSTTCTPPTCRWCRRRFGPACRPPPAEDPAWDVDLLAAGTGAERAAWEGRARREGLGETVRFLGFRTDVASIIAAADVLVHPARYEAYGLGVHEALCRGIPAIVSAGAGVAERYPAGLESLLIPDPDDPGSLAERLKHWRNNLEHFQTAVVPLADALGRHSWDQMAERIVQLIRAAA